MSKSFDNGAGTATHDHDMRDFLLMRQQDIQESVDEDIIHADLDRFANETPNAENGYARSPETPDAIRRAIADGHVELDKRIAGFNVTRCSDKARALVAFKQTIDQSMARGRMTTADSAKREIEDIEYFRDNPHAPPPGIPNFIRGAGEVYRDGIARAMAPPPRNADVG